MPIILNWKLDYSILNGTIRKGFKTAAERSIGI
jgi:hypothetical protein